MQRKVIPQHVIDQLYCVLRKYNIHVQVLLLSGESVEDSSGLEVTQIPLGFSGLISKLKQADLIVSADSLTAHLGEYLSKPTFVVSPSPNPYWLPYSAYSDSGCAVFGDLSGFKPWLEFQIDAISSYGKQP